MGNSSHVPILTSIESHKLSGGVQTFMARMITHNLDHNCSYEASSTAHKIAGGHRSISEQNGKMTEQNFI